MSRKIKSNGPNAAKKASKPKPASKRSRSSSQRVQAPVAKSLTLTTSRPQTKSDNGDIIISHREYIRDVTGSVAFSAVQIPVNPGIPSSFPWLSSIAQSYESYVFEFLEFAYETQAPTSSIGSVILAMDYDSNDDAPTSKAQVMSYRSSVRAAPWTSSCHKSLKEDIAKRKSYFVRNGDLSANRDKNLYDAGQLFLCRQGQAGTDTIGELYVSYRIRLMTPQLGVIGIGESIYGTFSGVSNSGPCATKSGNVPCTVSSSGTTTSVNTFTFTQQWEGNVSVYLVGTGLTGSTPTGTATSAESVELANAGATVLIALNLLEADAGETLILTFANTTISSCIVTFSQAAV